MWTKLPHETVSELLEAEIDAACRTVQMRAHGLACASTVPLGDRVSQPDVFGNGHFDDLLEHGAGACRIDREADPLGDEADEQREILVVRRLGDGTVEGEIGDDALLCPLLGPRHARQRLVDPLEILSGVVHGSETGRLDLKRHTQLKERAKTLRLGELAILDADRSGRGFADKCADSLDRKSVV